MAAFASLIFRYSSIAIQFLTVAIVTNVLPKDEAGWYFMLLGLVLSTYFMFGFGIPDGIVCVISKNAQSPMEDRFDLIKKGLVRSFVLTSPFLAISTFVGLANGSLRITLYCLFWWLSYALLFFCSQCMVAIGKKTEGSFFFYSAATWMSCLSVVPYLLLSAEPGLDGILTFTLVGVVPCAIVATFRLFSSFPKGGNASGERFDPSVVQIGFPICLSRVAQTALYWIPVWVVGLSLSANQAGDFAIASRLAIATNAFIAAIRFTVRPQLSNAKLEQNKKAIEALTRIIATLATGFVVLVMLGNFLVGKVAIGIIFGTQYSEASLLLTYLLIGTLGECFGGPVDEILKMSGFEKAVLASYALAVVFEVIACFILVPYGSVAVAVSQATTLVLLFGWFALKAYQDLSIFVGGHLVPSAFFESLKVIRPQSA